MLLPLTTHSVQLFSNTKQVKNETLYGLADLAHPRVRRTGKPKFCPPGVLSSRLGGTMGTRPPLPSWAPPGRGRACGDAAPPGQAGGRAPAPAGPRQLQEKLCLLPAVSPCGEESRQPRLLRAPRRPGLTGSWLPPLRPCGLPSWSPGAAGSVCAPLGGRMQTGRARRARAAGGHSAGTLQLWREVSPARASFTPDASPLPRPPPRRAVGRKARRG